MTPKSPKQHPDPAVQALLASLDLFQAAVKGDIHILQALHEASALGYVEGINKRYRFRVENWQFEEVRQYLIVFHGLHLLLWLLNAS